MSKTLPFDSALYCICERIKRILLFLPDAIKEKIEEIRLRNGLPLALTIEGKTCFLKPDGQTCFNILPSLLTVNESDIKETFRLLCENSVYAHTGELEQGYIMMHSGSRAGIFGTINESGNMQDISSINIRIAHAVYGAADDLICRFCGGFLIAGPPGSGKTTILRDMIRQLSDGERLLRVCVIDNRGELSGSRASYKAYDLGKTSDILIIQNKAKGIEIATRTMNPQIIAFDEIASTRELEKVNESFFAGVEIITTAHIGCVNELIKREVTRRLLQSGAVKTVAVLGKTHTQKPEIYSAEEILNEFDT